MHANAKERNQNDAWWFIPPPPFNNSKSGWLGSTVGFLSAKGLKLRVSIFFISFLLLLQTNVTILLDTMDICFPLLQCTFQFLPWTWRQKVSPKRRYPFKRPYIISHMTIIYISATMKIVRLGKSYYRTRVSPKLYEQELQKYNFRSKREFNYLLKKKSNTAIAYIVHYAVHKLPCHERTEFKPCTNKKEEKSLSHSRRRNGEQYRMIQVIRMLVPNGQSDDVQDT
jgi:hypothetical protein